ncbi:MAG: phosphate acyltransferase PlsX [Clostridiales bacterium]|nr:phosphate acyltransferase PlsX [Clostridiales bacterium]
MKIIIDAFGGDHAPSEIIKGTVQALGEFPELHVILTGDEQKINAELQKETQAPMDRISVVHAPDVISMDEPPVNAIKRKKNSSLVVGLELLKAREGDAFITCGSTGATLSGALLRVGRIRGILRPALAPMLPNERGTGVLLIDCGANMDCKPANLEQFAMMGDAYMRCVAGVENPRIALANVGVEDEKGNELTHAAYPLIKAHEELNFVGNMEARDVFSASDVIVSDGFAGNLLLKSVEGTAGYLMGTLKKEFLSSLRGKLGAMMLKPALKRVKKSMDYTEYGGAPLLGIDGIVLKGHGSSNAKAMASTVRQAVRMIDADIVGVIKSRLSQADSE